MTSTEIKQNLGAFISSTELMRNAQVLEFEHGRILQSYNTDIVIEDASEIFLTDAWEYSTTTGKHLNKFLLETKKETLKKINDGIYKLIIE